MADVAIPPSGGQFKLGSLKSLFGAGSIREASAGIAVVAVVMMMIVPMPTPLLDALMALNLVLALLILLIVLYTKHATDFTQFPTVLIITTITSLALNISSTRLILTKGSAFDGRMIKAFSSFVVGGGRGGGASTEGLVVGMVIFIVLIVVQVMVLTKGSTRIAEVQARFSLDSMQNKYLAIDTEFHAGTIDEQEAQRRRQAVQTEYQFYGTMDGASKFIQGSVKAGIFITVINILGGIIIGAAVHGEPITAAFGTYIRFAIGDGLLSQLPSLMISTATGFIVTRSLSTGTFAEDISQEFTQEPRIYYIGAAVLLVFSIIPGFPWYVLIPMAALLGFLGYRLTTTAGKRARAKEDAAIEAAKAKKTKEQVGDMSPVVPLDALSLEVGYGLIPLVDKDKGAELLERVQRLRRESALDLGLVIPPVRIVDNMRLDPAEYCLKIKGVEVGRGKIRMGCFMCINPGGVKTDIPGENTVDPAFGLPAKWITDEYRAKAEQAGLTVVDPPSIIATHLTEIIKSNAAEILGRQETSAILETLKKDYAAVVEEATKVLSIGEIQKVFQRLLHEGVSIRNSVAILETLADYAPVSKNAEFLTEKARQSLARQICLQYADDDHTLHVLTLDRALEKALVESGVDDNHGGRISALEPETHHKWIQALAKQVALVKEQGWMPPVILCSEAARALAKRACERELPEIVVLSVREIVQDVQVVAVGEVSIHEGE